LNISPDNSKPPERVGRKVTGLRKFYGGWITEARLYGCVLWDTVFIFSGDMRGENDEKICSIDIGVDTVVVYDCWGGLC
jgi:hypothetical protein